MAPSESSILTIYLINRAHLPTIISLREFTELFPRSQQASPHIRTLHRDLQAQRNALLDATAQEIDVEVRRGKGLRREMLRAKREAKQDDGDIEDEIERALFGTASGASHAPHTLDTIVHDLNDAAEALDTSTEKLREEEIALRESLNQTVGSMSDLRYGRFANAQLREGILNGLETLQNTCDK